MHRLNQETKGIVIVTTHGVHCCSLLGPVYTKRQQQCCDNSAMMLVILFSLKTMESLQNRVATYFQVIPLISMRTKSLASSQSGCRVDVDAWCKQALTLKNNIKHKYNIWPNDVKNICDRIMIKERCLCFSVHMQKS